MAFGRLTRPQGQRPFSDINMTPLIDVMLVLLIIFMVTAPLLSARLPLDLPKSDAPAAPLPASTLDVVLRADGSLYLGEQASTLAALTSRATLLARQRPDTEVQLRADQRVPYGRVAELIGILQQAGLQRVAFVTEVAPAPASTP
ncbi:MAG: biopolymer transporter ExbD [Aquabacterium sp.]|jgi:biopolymer transport protein TolR|uniref:ExbD/TolR family protein n=1 Tax=Aquabacterium sp. TaxID=1872578 RepID=UPI001B69C743|nr:biopolymer transporter ExbD [Aquabacterium sp.]MBP7131785.1 biopolymer transporter ExbD [Aquabacterium sp.]MBP9063210.1 biopolymer transporter ExbD [Aquabacterium sp.]MDQ5926752.1 biopolymer transport protein TolR [Pseudomonadota bacterium]